MRSPQQIAADLGIDVDSLRRAALSEGNFTDVVRVRGALSEEEFASLRAWAGSAAATSAANGGA